MPNAIRSFRLHRLLSVLAFSSMVVRPAPPVYGWNATGHKAISMLAYQQLTPALRQRIDHLLAKHPDYPKWTDGISEQDRGRVAFLAAAVWPDVIRNDPRFYAANRPATLPIPGLP